MKTSLTPKMLVDREQMVLVDNKGPDYFVSACKLRF